MIAKMRPAGPAKELAGYLNELGMSNRALARELDVTDNTVSRWIRRKSSPPAYVLAMLRKRAARRRRKANEPQH